MEFKHQGFTSSEEKSFKRKRRAPKNSDFPFSENLHTLEELFWKRSALKVPWKSDSCGWKFKPKNKKKAKNKEFLPKILRLASEIPCGAPWRLGKHRQRWVAGVARAHFKPAGAFNAHLKTKSNPAVSVHACSWALCLHHGDKQWIFLPSNASFSEPPRETSAHRLFSPPIFSSEGYFK